MKKPIAVYPFLIALYPIITLYSRNPGEIPAQDVLRPIVAAILLTGSLIALMTLAFKDILKAAFISALAIFYFSSSGHVYRIIKDYFFPISDLQFHPLLLIIEFLLIILITNKNVWNKYIYPERMKTITLYLNLVTVFILFYPAIILTNFIFSTKNDMNVPWTKLIEKQEEQQPLRVTQPLDIYYIVLDGYGRSDVLEKLYGMDNSDFLEKLKQKGFYVAEKSHSNYVQTPLSFSSFLNFAYIEFATDITGERSVNRLPLYDLIDESRAITLLGNAGYKLISTESGFQFTDLKTSDVYLSPYDSGLSTFERFFLSTTALDAVTELDNPLSRWVRNIIPIPGYSTHRENVLFSLDALTKKIPYIDGSKFVVVHIISPHPPFVLDRYGNSIKSSHPYMPGDGEAFGGSPQEYQQLYGEQVEYINARILEAIDAILENSKTPPIIIIQGDHGPGSLLRRDSIEVSCLWERSSILNAYYFPDGIIDQLYPSITPVNTFRVIFNTYFGTNYPLLPDSVYFSPQTFPYNFTEITNRADDICDNKP
jgi:hypothetical protein